MTAQAIATLRAHNEWRRGAETEMHDPAELGAAIDTVCDALESAQAELAALRAENERLRNDQAPLWIAAKALNTAIAERDQLRADHSQLQDYHLKVIDSYTQKLTELQSQLDAIRAVEVEPVAVVENIRDEHGNVSAWRTAKGELCCGDKLYTAAQLRAEVALALSRQWLPIETAPRDGTAILIMQNNWPGCRNGVATECNNHNTYVAAWWSEERSVRGGKGAWICYMDAVRDPEAPINPTNWQPLPPPPQPETTGQEGGNG